MSSARNEGHGAGRRPLPVRLRLTLSFLLAIGAVLVVIEWIDARALGALLDRVSREDMEIKIEQVRSDVRSPDEVRNLPDDLSLDGTMIAVVDPGGRVVARSPNLKGDDVPVPVRPTQEMQMTGRQVSGPILVATTSLAIVRHPGFQARIAIPLDEFAAARARKQISGAIALVAGLVLTGVAGYGFSLLALGPVERLRLAVEAIEAEDTGRRIDVSGIPRDEVGRLAATFNELLDRVAAARQKQQRFVEDASHDLLSPLTAIAGHAQLLLKRGRQDPSLWERPLQAIVKETERLRRLSEDLLILAQPPTAREGVPVVDAAEIAAELLADRATLHPALRLGILEHSPVRIGPDQLRRILGNLVDNALRAVEGGGEVEVSVRRIAGRMQLCVADTGVGIPPDLQARVFDRFFRLDRARGKELGGTGLGLAIVQALARQHGGGASLESRPGAGTKVTVDLPAEA